MIKSVYNRTWFRKRRGFLLLFGFLVLSSCKEITAPLQMPEDQVLFSFSVAADMRQYTGSNPDYFRGVCEAVESIGSGVFMISPGDIDPPANVLSTLQLYVDSGYVWYPGIGNHEAETTSDMAWLRQYNAYGASLPYIVNTGPPGCEETTYSFDYFNTHFVVLNEYYDGSGDHGTNGDVVDELYQWFLDDLDKNNKPVVIVFGHEPAYPQPDAESGRMRHEYDSLNQHPENRNRFWNTMRNYGVLAYVCGHTHNYSIIDTNGVWQIDCAHARGMGDTGARSTFLLFDVRLNEAVTCRTYRLDFETGRYVLTEAMQL